MANKLIKHEIKNTWLEITIVCSAIIVFSLIFGIIFKYKVDNIAITVLAAMMLGFSYIAVLSLVVINIVRSVNKKIFSDEGYLTLTLPVSIDELILSKIIVNFIWILLTYVTLFLSILIIGSTIIGTETFSEFAIFVSEHPLWVFIIIVSAAIETLVFILTLILVLSVLNTGRVKKFKLLVGVVFYYLIMQALTWIKAIVRIIPYMLTEGNNGLEIVKIGMSNNPIAIISGGHVGLDFNNLLFNIIAIIGFYFLSRYIIKNKLELE